MELVSKKKLLKEFEVQASFYSIRMGDQMFECRNQAKVNIIKNDVNGCVKTH